MRTKKSVMIETNLEICLSCHLKSCMHYQAYEKCLEFQCLALAESKYMKTVTILPLMQTQYYSRKMDTIASIGKKGSGIVIIAVGYVSKSLFYKRFFLNAANYQFPRRYLIIQQFQN